MSDPSAPVRGPLSGPKAEPPAEPREDRGIRHEPERASKWDLPAAELERRFWEGAELSGRFFMGESPVHKALAKLVATLERDHISYAIVGAMALNAYGHRRVTEDVDVLMTREGLEAFKARNLGLGYVEKFKGSKGMRDTEFGIGVDVIFEGEYPGDGKPKPVRFPNPSEGVAVGSLRLLPIHRFIELKLASGLSAVHRAKDLGDIASMIDTLDLPRALGADLDASVRYKYLEIWDSMAGAKKGGEPGRG